MKTKPRIKRRTSLILLVLVHFGLSAASVALGRPLQLYQFFLALIVPPVFLFEWSDRSARVFGIGLALTGYFIFGSKIAFWPPIAMSGSTIEILYWGFFGLRLLVLCVVINRIGELTRRNQRAEARINLMVSELRESARTSQALLTALPDAILKVSWDGRILDYISSEDSDIFKHEEPVVGKKWVDLLPLDFGLEAFKKIHAVAQDCSTRIFSCLIPVSNTDGSLSPRFFDLRFVASDPVEVLVIFQDITLRKEAERIIIEQQGQAAAASKMAALGEMAGGIAHEINNPLAIILGKAQQLKDLIESSELTPTDALKIAERIEATAMRISRIIRALRFFARDGASDPFERFSVKTVVDETLELCRERFASHRILLRVPEISDAEWIECRPVQIGQVLLNLLNNAHDAVEELNNPWVELGFRSLGDEVELSVTDSGSGIIAGLSERIFEPFYTTKAFGKGTGLGLSISRSFVEDHHGAIQIDAECAHTRFMIRLPRSQPL